MDELVDAVADLDQATPWRQLQGKARLQMTDRRLPAGNDVLVVHVGWLTSGCQDSFTWSVMKPGTVGAVDWLVLMDADTLRLLRGMRDAMQWPVNDQELAAMLAWQAKTAWDNERGT